jgi:hypothetical protein
MKYKMVGYENKLQNTCAIWVSNIVNKNKLHNTFAIYCMIWYQKVIPEEKLPNNSSSRIGCSIRW